jgi:hypothetical protein
MRGVIELVSVTPMVVWTGWAVYHWDHSHSVALFTHEPVELPNHAGHLDWGMCVSEKCTFDLLATAGIKPKDFPKKVAASMDCYYGDGRLGYHPPMPICLTIPQFLAELIGLYNTTPLGDR